MTVVTFEVRMRIDDKDVSEGKAILDARYKLMNQPGVLTVVQFGPVDNPHQRQEIEHC